ncbi:MAG: choice-of-anchor tandem repeat GloVer-containing protein [Limisphaerales bacterium]
MKKSIKEVYNTAIVTFFSWLALFTASAQTFTNLHSFGYADGIEPAAGLTVSGNVLYGTTHIGGLPGGQRGTVFRMNTDGSSFTNLHTFANDTNGGTLMGPVLLSGNTLYGTAFHGGASGCGCIFAINNDATDFTNLYSFSALQIHDPFNTNEDGVYPEGNLTLIGNTLFGTTYEGGWDSWGAVFALNTNGAPFTNIFNFAGTDGQSPAAGVIVANNVIYGVTKYGGSSDYGTGGSIFKMNTDGSGFTNLFFFTSQTGANGAIPVGNLVLLGNTLYGTTSAGGEFGNGAIYEINTDGTGLAVIHSFTGADGTNPQGGLLLWNNAFYGTAFAGGAYGNGTVFMLNTDGSGFTTLYNFSAEDEYGANLDGANPVGNLVASGTTLYGAASLGGANSWGAVFAISFPFPLNIAVSGTDVVLSWPSTAMNYGLEYTTNLTPPVTWTPIPSGTNTVVTNSIGPGQMFYQLSPQ